MNASTRFHVIIRTKDEHAAGVGADVTVFLKIHGDRGACKPISLGGEANKKSKVKRSPFAQNCTSQFQVRRPDIGSITSIDVWHNGKTAWGCDFIEIQKGNDSWRFTPAEPILSQQEREEQQLKEKKTRLVGEHSTVSNGANRFHQAAKSGMVDELEQMITDNEYDINCADKLGRTAAHYAALYGQITSLEVLLEYQCKVSKKDSNGRTVLHHACQNHINNVDIVELLLENAPDLKPNPDDETSDSDTPEERFIRAPDAFGKNAMHYAATHGFIPIVRLLDSRCSIALRDKDNTKQTPLHCAAIQGHKDVVLELIALGSLIDAVDREQKTFLHHAATCGHSDLIAAVFDTEIPGVTEASLAALLDAVDSTGRTPLLCAASSAHLPAIRVLERLGSDVYALDNDKSNALHLAAKRGDDKVLAYLSQKLDLNSTNSYGFTALHVAVNSDNSVSAAWLIKNKADLFAELVTGETPLKLAQAKKLEVMERALENAENMQMQVSKLNMLVNEVGGPEKTKAMPALAHVPEHQQGITEAPISGYGPSDDVEYVDTNPVDPEFMESYQRLVDKVAHFEHALIEKNAIIQAYRNKYGNINTNTNNLNGGARPQDGRQCDAESDCSIM